jgi:hypothetical protein
MTRFNNMFVFIEFLTIDIPTMYLNFAKIIGEMDNLYKLSSFYEKYCYEKEAQNADNTLPYSIFKQLTEKNENQAAAARSQKERKVAAPARILIPAAPLVKVLVFMHGECIR